MSETAFGPDEEVTPSDDTSVAIPVNPEVAADVLSDALTFDAPLHSSPEPEHNADGA